LRELFHPILESWFAERVGEPTEIQRLAWPPISRGEHVLAVAPTGSGKTLTAFLWAIQELLTGALEPGKVRVLYVSPLRALATDVRRNLERPLAELLERFHAAGHEVPEVRALVRSGDTPQNERRKMLRQPPEILITTPESLNILLTSRSGRKLLGGLETVILDEIHAVAPTHRGTHLITAVDRLVPLAGEFQRIALSATVEPLETIAEFVGGLRLVEPSVYERRPVRQVRSTETKSYRVKVRFPAPAEEPKTAIPGEDDENFWPRLVAELKREIRAHRSTLIFGNSRRMVEKITRLINDGESEELAYSHHGSLSREVRAVVERRLKAGELRAIVATSSLELGIDVGSLDQVILVQTPRSAASAIQRVGRAGHGVGEVSRGLFVPTFGRDLLEAAVVARAVADQEVEPMKPIEAPLDVLAQVILSMTANETWELEVLFGRLRASYPYRQLRRRQFDLVIEMLAGRYADSRIRELRPRLQLDRVAGTVRARPGVERLVYMAGGTIADRGYFALRLEESMAKIGELDEEFVWERSVGDSFTLGAQSWQIRRITHNDVLVVPQRRASAMAPFWRSDAEDRGFHLSERVGRFLERAESRLGASDFSAELEDTYHLEKAAVEELVSLLERQRAATGTALPHRRHLLVEKVRDPAERSEKEQVILHTFWGGRVNRPWALALAAAWEERYELPLEVTHEDDCILARSPGKIDVDELLELVVPDHLEDLLRRRLERTGYFGARFRLAASTALLLPRSGFRNRTPLWLSRQRSKNLLESVARYGDFPILVETWRACLEDGFELQALRQLLGEVRRGEIAVTVAHTHAASPFAANLVWQEVNRLMYEDDTPEGARTSNLRMDLLQELVFASHLRPRLPPELVEDFRRKIQRVAGGYAPSSGAELVVQVQERILMTGREWQELVEAVARDGGLDVAEVVAGVEERAIRLRLPGAEAEVVAALETVPRLVRELSGEDRLVEIEDLELSTLGGAELGPEIRGGLDRLFELDRREVSRREAAEEGEPGLGNLPGLVAEWLRGQGPVDPVWVGKVWGLSGVQLAEVLEELEETQRVVIDELRRGAEGPEVCDAENLEILLRWMRRDARPSFEARPVEELPLYLALYQGVARPGEGKSGLRDRLEQLFGYPAPAGEWEAEYLPVRLAPYYPAWLDGLMQESELVWFGCGREKVSFALASDLELFREEGDPEAAEEAEKLFPAGLGRFTLGELAEREGRGTGALSEVLWRLAWEGEVTSDAWVTVRKGVENGFRPVESKKDRRGSRRRPRGVRRGLERWGSEAGYQGSWWRFDPQVDELDALEEEELVKDRVRVLLDRYGVLFRELLEREPAPLRWARVFRTLRLMELSGEVLAGHFFTGIPGLQFISHGAFRDLRRGLPRDVIYWLNAGDPASLCGVGIEKLKGELPARQRSTHLVYHGTLLALISKRRGKELEIRVDAAHPHLADYFALFKVFLTRDCRPMTSVEIETINGESALASPFLEVLGENFQLTREARSVKLWKRY